MPTQPYNPIWLALLPSIEHALFSVRESLHSRYRPHIILPILHTPAFQLACGIAMFSNKYRAVPTGEDAAAHARGSPFSIPRTLLFALPLVILQAIEIALLVSLVKRPDRRDPHAGIL